MTGPEAEYRRQTPRSKTLHERAARSMPGGTTRTTTYFEPYPLFLERGEGCHVWDVDGNQRLDFICNYSSMILGHAHPAIVRAVSAQVARGTGWAAAHSAEVELAEELCRRVPSIELVRFCNSGTEATMFALRLCRVFTRKRKTARFEGGYHGTHDFAEVSTRPSLEAAGPPDEPLAVPDSAGTPIEAVAATVVLPFNDIAACERILRRRASEIGSVIVEPVVGSGAITPEPGFLEALRRITSELNILLVFDEVISLRLAPGGAQERFNVKPDLTTMGKIIGGGLPVAAFGGREDVMHLLDPRLPDFMPQGGTFNGNALGMAAGLAALAELTPQVYDELDRTGERVRAGLRAAFEERDIAAQVTGIGSLFCTHFTSHAVRDYRSAASRDRHLSHVFFLSMLNHGVLLAPRGLGAIPAVAGELEVARLLTAAQNAAADVAKLIGN